MSHEQEGWLLRQRSHGKRDPHLKVEAIHDERFAASKQANAHVFEHNEVYYIRQRLPSAWDYLGPIEFELRYIA